ncbi:MULTISPECIES: hypothetical protein [Mammaliicoccus]|uniref:hypothetical protein n=1 Tax=Mammaliicoccus TaxID=2803850 RepID=UPI001EFB59B3|nr:MULTISPECIES: hypothetical protein [Mammaliicoccus]WQJ66649.1 hypothetical protein P3T97_04330 [Mammaliicoccus sciuri]
MKFLLDVLLFIISLMIGFIILNVNDTLLFAFAAFGAYKMIDSFVRNLIRGEA